MIFFFFLSSVLDDHVTWTVGLVAHWTSGACATGAFSPGWCHPHLSAHASPPGSSVGQGGSLSSWATLVWLIRNVGGVPTAPPGTRFHPDPAVWTSVWPLDLVSRPSLVCRCWGWVLLCIRYRLGRHTKIVRFTEVVENVVLKSPLLWPKPSCWLKLPAFTPSSPPVQLSENIGAWVDSSISSTNSWNTAYTLFYLCFVKQFMFLRKVLHFEIFWSKKIKTLIGDHWNHADCLGFTIFNLLLQQLLSRFCSFPDNSTKTQLCSQTLKKSSQYRIPRGQMTHT